MKKTGYFWVGFADLMTSLFFIMLVLYVITFAIVSQKDIKLKETVKELRVKEKALLEKEKTLNLTVKDLQQKLKVFTMVEENLKPLKENNTLFKYEKKYKRFILSFDVNFILGKHQIKKGNLYNYEETASKIKEVGKELQRIINQLVEKKKTNIELKNVSYLLIISGYASQLENPSQLKDYILSYKRAYNLWNYWKSQDINFENSEYKGLIDLQLSGNGWGGVGRFKRDPNSKFINESKNQRFIIQIIPKIAKTE